LGFVFCILGLNSTNYAYGQSIVNNSKFKNLKVEVDKRVDVKVGGNDCGTTITRLRSVGNAVVVTAVAPSNKQCSFVNLSLSIGSKIAPLKALDGGYKFQDVEAGYRWGDGVANADMWFEPFDAGLLSTENIDIKLSDSACTGSQCVAQCLSSKCGQNAKAFAVLRQKQEAQERREAADRENRERDRVANACNNFYQGKSIGFKPASFIYLGNTLDAVVLGKGNGNVSIKIVDRHFTDLYGKTLEMSCTSDQLQ
jgi:hypothetical protein